MGSSSARSMRSPPSAYIVRWAVMGLVWWLFVTCVETSNVTCEHIQSHEDECDFVHNACASVSDMFDYLGLIFCRLQRAQFVAYALLVVWLAVLVSLVASTAEMFFAPALRRLATRLHLSPEIAGITLLAWGNGANDIFTSVAAVSEDDFSLMFGSILGTNMLITTLILGLLIVRNQQASLPVAPAAFYRDIISYMVAAVYIMVVVLSGTITLALALLFLVFYVVYVAYVIVASRRRGAGGDQSTATVDSPVAGDTTDTAALVAHPESLSDTDDDDRGDDQLPGLKPPAGSLWGRMRYWVEFPFSILRLLSIPLSLECKQPPTALRRWQCVVWPCGLTFLTAFAVADWDALSQGSLPCPPWAILLMCGVVVSCVLFLLLRPDRATRSPAPRWLVWMFELCCFVGACEWLSILADECVSVVRSIGVAWQVSSALLGITVLAVANSSEDIANDLAVARSGSLATSISACFGSPLLNDLVGLGVALVLTCSKQYPQAFHPQLRTSIPVGWAFLFLSLCSSLACFHFTAFNPPRHFGFFLISIYVVFFVVVCVLEA